MASRNDGIQLLLQAEKKAADKVSEAKRRKVKRLQEAKSEAATEIGIEKKERERRYKLREDEVFGRRSNTEAEIAAVTQKTLDMQAESVQKNKDVAIQSLLERVLAVDPQVHINYRPQQKAQ
ncbi:V-type proton ATPase subunit G 1 [Taenia solium]|eukprot:TsM_000824300 transcript=TsM_000824300 gene=TsM_000824300